MRTIKLYEAKLQEYMTMDEYMAFAQEVAKLTFFAEVNESPSEEFKKMVFDNWDFITGSISDNEEV